MLLRPFEVRPRTFVGSKLKLSHTIRDPDMTLLHMFCLLGLCIVHPFCRMFTCYTGRHGHWTSTLDCNLSLQTTVMNMTESDHAGSPLLPQPDSTVTDAPTDRQWDSTVCSLRPCKVLLCGREGSGQTHVTAAALKLLQGVPIHTLSLPQLVMGGSGDAAAGLVEILQEAQRR